MNLSGIHFSCSEEICVCAERISVFWKALNTSFNKEDDDDDDDDADNDDDDDEDQHITLQ